ncbi:DUF4186 domain-containing protein [Roseovarius sp. D22-M7]|uniref:DUF4186 domain-containing protein n=1 Tax=Roseovarius sp. D22-M7 TaxID=3127116 RepID=UPI00300FDDA2
MTGQDFDALFARLSRSAFRARFRLGAKETSYLAARGMDVIRSHAVDFVAQRLAPSEPKNDGKQTPMRGHPVFVAQHATATCCRSCLAKWHGMQEPPTEDIRQDGHRCGAASKKLSFMAPPSIVQPVDVRSASHASP